ncbi:ribosome small subunit-dependent GTPase [Leptolyngbya sp. BL0902]|uniref:small ribosomal subunit biogenesis GTPase RsgA n=1 Tax=Leptolyngbya sp. BL0902 TaxID=1115757 RepID=UPI0019382D36|nr:small ribosomal subunit biogenesis GTPase RsgA [Leptolyngbya sp. BL0902]QQE65409.1 ribosome small subunit-dependent GTPase [Leptolyngbya sp. BL0902]
MSRTIASPSTEPETPLWGVVTAVQANYYWVTLEQDAHREVLPCRALLCIRRARLKKIGQRVMVGDRVQVVDPDWEGQRGAIAAVAPRQTVLDRPPIANADQVLLLFALAEPDLDPHQLSRFLVKAESTGLSVLLCFNKQDLVTDHTRRLWQHRLRQWGYDPLLISLHQGEDWLTLQPRLQGRVTVVSGPSGVGKSSLINRLIPAAHLRTNAVSGKLGRGRHTTRHVELFPLPQGGLLADTPGFNQPDLTLHPADLGSCFPEIRRRLAQDACQFNDCLHGDEPGCAVGNDWDRYDLYSTLVAEAEALQAAQASRSPDQAQLKRKVGGLGEIHQEPMLQAKKYRRVSRRRQRQALEDLHYTTTDGADWEDLDDDRSDLRC